VWASDAEDREGGGGGGGGGGGYSTNRLNREAPPRGPTPLIPIYIPLFTKKRIPFVYLLLTHGTPFTYLFNNFASLLTDVNALSFK